MLSAFKKSLTNSITFSISIILIVVLGVAGIVYFKYNYEQIIEDTTSQTYLKAESISKDVRNIFENANIITEQMSINSEIKNYLLTAVNRESVKENQYYESVLETLVNIKDSSSTHFLAWVSNEEANFYLDNNGIVPDDTYDVTTRPWYEIAVKSDGVAFTPPYVEWDTQRIVISSIQALREVGEVYGFVVVDIVLDTIPEIFEKGKQGNNDLSFLVTNDDTYVYHHNSEKIMNSKVSDKDDPLSDYIENINNPTYELIDVNYEGKEYFMMSYLVDNNGWKVITLIDKVSINKKVSKAIYLVIFSFILALIASVIMVYYVTRHSTKPYSILVSYANDIANGELSKNIPKEYLMRTDEMGKISKSFQKITDVFRNENVILEEKIEEKNLELESQYKYILETEKVASLGSLVAGISHEINTPLGVGISSASYLERINIETKEQLLNGTMTKNDLINFMEKVAESTALLNSSLDRAGKLVKSFKQIAVDQSSEVKYKFNLHDCITAVILSLRHEYKKLNHVLINDCPKSIELNSYPGAFTQIFTNLIMNSIKHGFKDTNNGCIKISAIETENSIKITYEDNGIGISEENLKRIYEPFFTTNRGNGSSGLGMHIVFNIVNQKLGGQISGESEITKGIKFTIQINI